MLFVSSVLQKQPSSQEVENIALLLFESHLQFLLAILTSVDSRLASNSTSPLPTMLSSPPTAQAFYDQGARLADHVLATIRKAQEEKSWSDIVPERHHGAEILTKNLKRQRNKQRLFESCWPFKGSYKAI